MRVLVTGAFGTIGGPTVLELLRQDHQVRCLDLPGRTARRAARRLDGEVEFHWGCISDQGLLERAVPGCDAVIHNAAVLWPFTERRPGKARAVNVGGTRALITAMEATETRPLLIYSSSVSIYGPAPDRQPPLTAEDPVNPSDHYTRHKAECERIIRDSDLPWVILRIGVCLDPGVRNASPEAFRTLFDVSPDNRLEYIHPADAALAQANALECPGVVGKTLLVGGGPECRIRQRDLFEAFCPALGLKPFPSRAFGTRDFYTDWMDTGEAQELLAFQRHSFAEYREALFASLAGVRRLITPIRPLVRSFLLRYSAPYRRASLAPDRPSR